MDYFLSHATEPKELIVFDEAGHTGGWKMAPEVYQATIIRFFDEALLQPQGLLENWTLAFFQFLNAGNFYLTLDVNKHRLNW